MSGSLISFGSARKYLTSFMTSVNPSRLAFELVKVSHMSSLNVFLKIFQVRRQLEYSIAASRGVSLVKPPTTMEAVREILRNYGCRGLYLGFRLHFSKFRPGLTKLVNDFECAVRDTAGTALYFFEYDGMRHLMGRQRSGEQGPTPSWLPIHSSIVPFVCGSCAGVRNSFLGLLLS